MVILNIGNREQTSLAVSLESDGYSVHLELGRDAAELVSQGAGDFGQRDAEAVLRLTPRVRRDSNSEGEPVQPSSRCAFPSRMSATIESSSWFVVPSRRFSL